MKSSRSLLRQPPNTRLKLAALRPPVRAMAHRPSSVRLSAARSWGHHSRSLGDTMRILTLPACLMLMAAPPLHSQAAPATPSALHWGSAPAVFPAGARMAVLSGDPTKAGPFTVELGFPAGYKIPPLPSHC